MSRQVLIVALFLGVYMFVNPIIPFVEYAAFKSFIVEYLCVEREKPENSCNGMCHLKEQVRNQQEQEQGQEGQTVKLKVDYQQDLPIEIMKLGSFNHATNFDFFYFVKYSYTCELDIFHPPKTIV